MKPQNQDASKFNGLRMTKKTIKFIDLCAGIGGFHSGLAQQGGECVLACEIDKFARTTYLANYQGDFLMEENIFALDTNELPDYDVLCAGFPCQSFSMAGDRKGFNDHRGTIFFDIVRILSASRPPAFILENVKNLFHHEKGETFKRIQQEIHQINYLFFPIILNAKHYVPQNRERVYLIGLNAELFYLNDLESLKQNIELNYNNQQKKPTPNFWNIISESYDESLILSDKLWGFLQRHAEKHKKKGNGFGYGLMTPELQTSRTLTSRYYKDGSEILVSLGENKKPRRLSPQECARLMGFPENFVIPVSRTQAYKQMGNSVVVPIISMIAKNLFGTLISK